MKIDDKQIGGGSPCFIIAEAGINHNGSFGMATEMVLAAAKAGADAIKFQTHFPEHEMLRDGVSASYVGESLFDLLTRVSLTRDDHFKLKKLAERSGMIFMSTPFSREAADFLDELGISVFKTGSGELTNLPLLEHIAQKGKPMIISTGMSSSEEIELTVGRVKAINPHFALMHCTSTYPTPYEHMNLGYINKLKAKFGVPVGLSDHSIGNYVAFAAPPLGASLIEKHFTLSRDLPGPDQQASIEPEELAELVKGIRAIEKALGDEKLIQPGEQEVRNMANHSVVTIKDLPAGKIIEADDVWVKRPGIGIPAKHLPDIIGKKAKKNIKNDVLLSWDDID